MEMYLIYMCILYSLVVTDLINSFLVAKIHIYISTMPHSVLYCRSINNMLIQPWVPSPFSVSFSRFDS